MSFNSMRAPGFRVTHIHEDITVECYGYRTLEKNREMAMKVLRAKLYARQNPEPPHHTLIIEHGNGDDMQLFIDELKEFK